MLLTKLNQLTYYSIIMDTSIIHNKISVKNVEHFGDKFKAFL